MRRADAKIQNWNVGPINVTHNLVHSPNSSIGSGKGPWCNGSTSSCPVRRCGFESRRVHSSPGLVGKLLEGLRTGRLSNSKSNVDFVRRVSDNEVVTGQVDGPELATVRGLVFLYYISFRVASSILLNVVSLPSTSSVSNNGGAFLRPQTATRIGWNIWPGLIPSSCAAVWRAWSNGSC